MLLIIDNYDSFTYNLVHYLGELGAESIVFRNDSISVEEVINNKPDGIVISPGPGDPDRAGICLSLIKSLAGKIPILGVCLGHQAIGQAFGGSIVRSPEIMHGKLSSINHQGEGIFNNIPNNFIATRYHSLTIDPDNFPKELEITAVTNEQIIMGIRHRQYEIYGLQFHPESIASEQGHEILNNFLNITTKQ